MIFKNIILQKFLVSESNLIFPLQIAGGEEDAEDDSTSVTSKDWVALRSLTGLNVSGWKFQVG